jgi:hypothetical protein
MDAQAHVKPKRAEFRPVIIRACPCGHPREQGSPCAGCGNPEPPVTADLGLQAAVYRNPLRQAWWDAIGSRMAKRRARKANAAIRR